MKKLLTLSAIALGLSTSAFANTAPMHNVNIVGNVYNQTCKFVDASGSDSRATTVTLDKISAEEVTTTAKKIKDFTIRIAGCDVKSAQHVSVAFDVNSPNITTEGNLKNTSNTPTASTGVQIQLLKSDGATAINLNDAEAVKTTPLYQRALVDGKAEFKFQAGYIQEPNGTVTAGGVTSSIPLKIVYQ